MTDEKFNELERLIKVMSWKRMNSNVFKKCYHSVDNNFYDTAKLSYFELIVL